MKSPNKNRVLFFVLFVIPLIITAYYEIAIASDRYQSEASLVINQENSGTTTFDVSFLGLPSSADDRDALSVVEFIMSRDMLHYLDEKLHLRDHYSAAKVDWLARFSNTGSFEQFHDYMANWLVVTYDPTSKLIRMQLQSFDENYSKAVLDAVNEVILNGTSPQEAVKSAADKVQAMLDDYWASVKA